YTCEPMRKQLLLFSSLALVAFIFIAGGRQFSQRQELVRNSGFEEGGSGVPRGWVRDLKYTGKKGSVSLDRSRQHTGRASLKLQPNSQNGGDFPLAIAQVIPAAA